jgi:hypothetical protein
VGVKHEFQVGDLLVTKIESWDFKAKAANIAFTVEFPEDCCDFLTNVTQDGPFALRKKNLMTNFSIVHFSISNSVVFKSFEH